MKLLFTQVINIDLDKERKRLKNCFKGAKLKRHLHLVDLFEQGKTEEFHEFYDNLPYDKEGEYPEQENVGDYAKYALEDRGFQKPYSVVKTETSQTFKLTEDQKEITIKL